jgi:hypothetical protein
MQNLLKVLGKDEFPAELLEQGGEYKTQPLHRLTCKIWMEEKMPGD